MANGTFLTSTPASEAPLSQATHVVSSTEINPHLPSGSEIVHPPLIFSTDISMECQDTSPARCITHSPSQPQQEKTTALKFVQHFIPIINNKSLASSTTHDTDPVKFVPSLGSWAKPLFFKPPATPPEPSTPQGYDPAIVGNQLAADGSLRFPWAARLSPQSRNLYRAATPTYRLDGTPEVSIPSKVLRLGPENKDEYIIGKFHRCSLPPGDLIHVVVNKIWGRSYSEMNPHFPSSAQTDPQPQQENNTTLPNLSNTLLPLVDSQSAPTQTTIMETSPSNIINNVVLKTPVVDPLTTTPQAGAFESPSRFTVLRVIDEVETDPKSSFSLTRGGRETKPPIKYQDMEWKTMQGRGKHGRRGRGSSH
ncbi:hypothetical protein F2Q70_00009704 [Brassica cretica]|uniref:Uncharacterized protein n=1 Tax=Brassica cretica TaxID=69181 RepID=A0A8S9LXU2_BRACR|nr:hypothetical protein F2Q70_00009704 [Brassica cretica]